MAQMPVLEKAVGRDCMMAAYFNNDLQRMRTAIDGLLGAGSWDKMCALSYDWLYHHSEQAERGFFNYLHRLAAL